MTSARTRSSARINTVRRARGGDGARAAGAGWRTRGTAPQEGGGAGDRRSRVRLARGCRRGAAGQEARRGRAGRGADEEIELEDEPIDDAAFIEEQEEGDEDVTDIIGDVEDEEET